MNLSCSSINLKDGLATSQTGPKKCVQVMIPVAEYHPITSVNGSYPW